MTIGSLHLFNDTSVALVILIVSVIKVSQKLEKLLIVTSFIVQRFDFKVERLPVGAFKERSGTANFEDTP